MSAGKKSKQSGAQSVAQSDAQSVAASGYAGMTLPETQPPMLSPEQAERVNKLLSDLIANATKLSIKLAICDCDSKDECEIFEIAKKIAKTIDEMQNVT